MARQPDNPQPDRDPRGSPDELAARIRGLLPDDPVVIPACLTRLTAAICGGPAPTSDEDDYLRPRSLEAFLSPLVARLGRGDQLADLLLAGDLAAIDRRRRVVDHLKNPLAPFMTLTELGQHLEEFDGYLFQHRAHLVRTGLAELPFLPRLTPNRWLFSKLGRLYVVRTTFSDWPYGDRTRAFGDGRVRWRRSVRRAVRLPVKGTSRDRNLVLNGLSAGRTRYEECAYEQAELLRGLAPEDAERVELLRERVHSAKSKVLRVLARAVRRTSHADVWGECLAALGETLGGDDVEFLFSVDGFYLNRTAKSSAAGEVDPDLTPGGLTDLLDVIAHVEQELTVGRYTTAKEGLTVGVWSPVVESEHGYVEAVANGTHSVIDGVLDGFDDRRGTVREFLDAFRARLTSGFAERFRVQVGTAPAPDQALLNALLPPLLGQIKASLADPNESRSTEPPGTPTQANRYTYDRGEFTISFRGQGPFTFKEKGFFYIHQLLQHPGVPIDPEELRARELGMYRESVAEADAELSGLPLTGGQPVLDAQAVRELRHRLSEVEDELSAAERRGDPPALAELREERDSLERQLQDAYTPSGTPRLINDRKKNATDAIRNAINRAIAKLSKKLAPLANHLDITIVRSTTCYYRPDQDIDWRL